MRKEQHMLTLADKTIVRYSLGSQKGEPFYFVYFRGRDGSRLQRSTKTGSQKRALEVAAQIIADEYTQPQNNERVGPTWQEAWDKCEHAMKARNLRPPTIRAYRDAVNQLRKHYPASLGPMDITPDLAVKFLTDYANSPYTRQTENARQPKPHYEGKPGPKPKPPKDAKVYYRSAQAVRSRLRHLDSFWDHWLIGQTKQLTVNPWHAVQPPKVDKPDPRYITKAEEAAYFQWLDGKTKGWQLPVLFYKVKGLIGCRITELATVKSEALRDGRIYLAADQAKGRREGSFKLPPDLYTELQAVKGETWLWEQFPEGLARFAQRVQPDFSPERMVWWLQDQVTEYNHRNKDKPGFVPFTSHNFRGTAMSAAYEAGLSLEDAALAFRCNTGTMKQHYLKMDKEARADEAIERVLQARQNGSGDTKPS